MRTTFTVLATIALLTTAAGSALAVDLRVSDPGGVAGRVGAPVAVPIDLAAQFGSQVDPGRLSLAELSGPGQAPGKPIAVQFEPGAAGAPEGQPAAARSLQGTLWLVMPPGTAEQRTFRLTLADASVPAELTVGPADAGSRYDVREGALPVLRYNQGTVPVPAGVDPVYARGDYISPLFGLEGEVLTDDYPKDHPHHRGVGWSWPVTRWKDEVRDIWAVRGVWSRPVAMPLTQGGPVLAVLCAENVWKWGDQDPIVREDVAIRAFRKGPVGRFVDVEVRLTALADGVAIGGRPHAGYGGFGLRAAPCQDRQIALLRDPEGASPRRSWIDYSGVFAGGKGRSGLAIFEHPANPDYPSELQQYPDCNYAMPAFPGQREVPLSKDKPLVLKHRLWIHSGPADEKALSDVWAAYASPPAATIEK